MKRREFLASMAITSAALMAPTVVSARPITEEERKLRLFNIHTGERLTATYWAAGQYQVDELTAINRLLRDHRSNEMAVIDPRLFDQLYSVQEGLGKHDFFEIISGYRSPESNKKLHENTDGVAKRSLHMDGKAIDVRLRGVDIQHLRQAALKMKAGGVGYYPESNFVHLDTGRVRYW